MTDRDFSWALVMATHYPHRRRCCGAHKDSNDPCCAIREQELAMIDAAGVPAELLDEPKAGVSLATAEAQRSPDF